jgi:hypothetical protein
VLSFFATLMVLAALAVPIVFVAKIVRRVREVSQRLQDPTRLQRVFAETAAAALRRAGADPQAVAKVEVLGQGAADERGADLRAALYEARTGMRQHGAAVPVRPAAPAVPVPEPLSSFEREPRPQLPRSAPPRAALEHSLHRTPRPRRQHPPVAPLGSFDAGDHFRLSEPAETGEPHGPLQFNANWLALAAVVGAAAYYLLR